MATQAKMDLINRAYVDVMTTGDAKGCMIASHPNLQHHALRRG